MNIQDKIDQLESLKRKGITEVFAPVYTAADLYDICHSNNTTSASLGRTSLIKFIDVLDTADMDVLLDRIRELHDEVTKVEVGDIVRHKETDNVGIVIAIDTTTSTDNVTVIFDDGDTSTCHQFNLAVIRKRSEVLSFKE